MAFVTRHTFSKLCSDLNVKFELKKDEFLKTVFSEEHFYYVFNSTERRFLFIYSSILEDEELFKIKYFNNIPEREDHYQYVHESAGKSKYHLFDDCPMLFRDFEDFLVPQEIRKMQNIDGISIIKEFRQWFDYNDFTERYHMNEINSKQIVIEYNQKFPKEYGVGELNEDFDFHVRVPNSGYTVVDKEFNLEDFKFEIEDFKLRFDTEFSSHDWRLFSKFSNFSRGMSKYEIISAIDNKFPEAKLIDRFSDDYLINKVMLAKELKYNMISLILKYLRWHKNFDKKEFNAKSLDEFGLRCCAFCERNSL